MRRNKYLIFMYLIAALLVLFSLHGLKSLAVNNEIVDWLPSNHHEVVEYTKRISENGYSTHITVVTALADEGIHWSDFNAINERGELLANLPGSPGVDFLLSKTKKQWALGGGVVDSKEKFNKLMQDFSEHPERYRLFGKPGKPMVVYNLTLEGREKNEALETELVDSLYVLKKHPAFSGVKLYSAGTPVTAHGLNAAVFKEGFAILGISYGVLIALLILFLRNRYHVIKGILVLLLTSLTTHGLMGLLHIPLNIMTISVSSLVLIISIADVVHISSYLKKDPSGPLKEIFIPCFWTTLTTVLGFGSLALSNLPILEQFGTASSVGIVSALFWSFFCFSFRRKKAGSSDFKAVQFKFSHKLILGTLKSRPLATAFLLALAASSVFIKDIKVDADPISYLPKESEAAKNLNWVWDNLYSPTRLEIWITPLKGNILDSSNLEYVMAALKILEANRETSDIFSAFSGYSHQEIRGMLAAEGNPFREIEQANELEVSIGTPGQLSSREISDWKHSLSQMEFAGLESGFQGFISLSGMMFDHILVTQVKSGITALVLISLVLIGILRNVRLILFALLVNILPAIAILSYLAFNGLELDITTVCITSILMGVVVDDTIHMMWTVKQFSSSPNFAEKFRECISAVSCTTVILTMGFGTLAFSEVKSIHLFGLLMALGIVTAWILDVAAIAFIVKKESYRDA